MNVGFLKKAMFGYGVACLISATVVQARDIFVDGVCGSNSNSGQKDDCSDQVDGPKLTIVGMDSALAAAVAEDVIKVAPGDYIISQDINVTIPVTFLCSGVAGSCVIEGGMKTEDFDDPVRTHGFNIQGDGNSMGDPANSQAEIIGFIIQDTKNAGIAVDNASPTIRNCIIRFCGETDVLQQATEDAQAGGIELINAERAKILSCFIESNTGGVDPNDFGRPTSGAGGGGILIHGGEPTIDGCTISGNTSVGTGGGIMVAFGATPIIKNCLITNNKSKQHGGGIGTGKSNLLTSPQIVNCVVASNEADGNANGIELCQTQDALIQNCLITGNKNPDQTSGLGGGVWTVDGVLNAEPQIINSTIAYNNAQLGGGIALDTSTRMFNTILYNNTSLNGEQACVFGGGTVLDIDYSDIQGGLAGIVFDGGATVSYGQNNIDQDPQFIDFDGLDNDVLTWHDNNFRVGNTAPVIDAASNSRVAADISDLDDDGDTMEPTPWDLDKIARFSDAITVANTGEGSTNQIVDMGAFEVSEQPDVLFTKDRYVSFMTSMTPGMRSNEPMIIRLTRLAADPTNNLVRFVDCTPHPIPDTGEDGNAYYLVDTTNPSACLWTDLVIHVTGCEIRPGASGESYDVHTSTDDGTTWMLLTNVSTTPPQFPARQYGDVVGQLENDIWTAPDGLVTTNDIVAALRAFSQNKPPHRTRVDLVGSTPNQLIGADDILAVVDAFGGECYKPAWKCVCVLGCGSADDEGPCPPPITGGPESTFSIVASESTINPGQTVNVDVFIDAATDLAGY